MRGFKSCKGEHDPEYYKSPTWACKIIWVDGVSHSIDLMLSGEKKIKLEYHQAVELAVYALGYFSWNIVKDHVNKLNSQLSCLLFK